jgi:hypothetical protein
VAPCGVCGRPMRSDKVKQHLLSHSRQKGRDSRGRYFSQDRVAPDGGSSLNSFAPCGGSVSGSAPCGGSVGRVAPCGGSPQRGHEEQGHIDEGTSLEAKRAAVRGLARAIIDRLTELQCDKILGLAKGRKRPFTP